MIILALILSDTGNDFPLKSSIKERNLDKENAITYHPPHTRKIMKDYLSKSHIKFTDSTHSHNPTPKIGTLNALTTSEMTSEDRKLSTQSSTLQGLKNSKILGRHSVSPFLLPLQSSHYPSLPLFLSNSLQIDFAASPASSTPCPITVSKTFYSQKTSLLQSQEEIQKSQKNNQNLKTSVHLGSYQDFGKIGGF